MKIRCLDPDTFLLSMKQHTILVNCPLKTRQIQRNEPDTDMNDYNETNDYATTLDSVLAPFHPLAKQSARYSIDNNTNTQEQQHAFTWSRMIAMDGVDISTIDVVLLTQYEHLLGLPYLTEYLGYQGKIVATEPTIEFARQRMEELVHYRSTTSAPCTFYDELDGNDLTMEWQSIYTLKDIACCIEKIQPVRYNERMSLFSTLDVMAYSSGYSLGSSNWLIETSMKKIVVLSASCTRPELHPALLDTTLLHSADMILVSGISNDDQTMTPNPNLRPTYERQLKKSLSHIAGTLSARHNVILPISITSGLVYDLIWMICSHLRSLGMEIGKESHQIPMYMISPIAEQSLQYANICGEWMTNECQEQLWKPSMPLPHGNLMKTGALTTFTTMASIPLSITKNLLSSPCLVFTGDHQVLSHGALDWFMENWGTDSNNLCLFTDPNMSTEQLHKYDKADMTVLHLPLDTRLTMKQVMDLIQLHWKTVTTKHLILPRMPSTATLLHSGLDNIHTQLYSLGEMINIDLDFEWEQISISSELARDVKTIEIPGMTTNNERKQMAPISGDLQIYNNHLVLHRMTSQLDTNFALMSSSTSLNTHQLDSTNLSDMKNKLHKIGINDITTEQGDQCLILGFRLPSPSLTINQLKIYDNKVVIKAVDEETRLMIAHALIDGQ